ncbi:unnamed protein product [Ceutorhynchus assimilis]|uniref:Uncharacterized protein n=1 Tax=Ceutorhynchus assimilis TaxID=467358 RepID=A0A9N9MXC8_9CUCU|nr:unnamed protein product [Ceutorhynchus assimilis]
MDKLSGPSNSDEHQPLKVIPGSSRCNNSRLLPLNSPRNNVSERILTSTLTEGTCSDSNPERIPRSTVGESTPQGISTPGRRQPLPELNEKILQVLYEVREQNSQILNVLQKKISEATAVL